MSARQLPLPLPHTPDYGAADFLDAESNAAARAWLAAPQSWPQGRLALWGEAGSGKTHLLHLWARQHGAALLAGPSLRGPVMASARPLVIDDADACAEPIALLHTINASAERGSLLLLAGRTPPARWAVRPADLDSRLRASLAVGIAPAEEALLQRLLARLLAERQLAVGEAVQAFLLARLPRQPGALREAAARLDRAALAAGGRISRTLAMSVIESMQADAG